LKLKCDELLSHFAFNFNLRRYEKVVARMQSAAKALSDSARARHVINRNLNPRFLS